MAQELLNSLGTKPGAAFLDPCCGSGTFLTLAQDMGLKVSGMDSDPIAVMIAKANLILAGATEYPDVRVTDFVSRWKSERRRFDFAATNPPWSSKTKNVYADVSSFFFMKTLSLLKSGGRLAFLMPISMLNIASHRLFREQLFSDCKLLEIRKFDTKFSGVQTDFVSILAEKAKPAETFRMIGTGEVREIPLSLFQLTEQKTIFSVTEPEVEIIYKILSKGELSLAAANSQNQINQKERKAAGRTHLIGEAPDVAQADRRTNSSHQETKIGSKAFSFFHCILSLLKNMFPCLLTGNIPQRRHAVGTNPVWMIFPPFRV